MSARVVLVSAVLLGSACTGCYDENFAVDVTIEADASVGGQIARLAVQVSGDDQFTGTVDVGGKLAQGSAGWIYRPRPGSHGHAHLAFTAEDGQGVIIASGSADAALVPSRTTSATAVLSPVMGDPPDMTAPPDMTTPPDMTAPPTCGEPPAPGGRTQFYVDAHYTGAETGEPLCPYTSITAAIAHADLSSAANKIIHVAAGTYDATRETFPLVLRGGVSVVGAGANVTAIVGSGEYDHTALGGTVADKLRLTILVGDAAATQTISGLSVRSTETGTWGIYCDRGNAYPPLSTGDAAPNLVMDEIHIGGFERSIIVGTSDNPAPSGCNLLLRHSEVSSTLVGLFITGSYFDNGTNNFYRVSAHIGDGMMMAGNTFSGNRSSGGIATAILVFDGSTPVSILGNTFTDNDIGISLNNYGTEVIADVEGNSFTAMTNSAVQLNGNYNLRSLRNNFFGANNAPAGSTRHTCGSTITLASAICVHGYGTKLPGPQIQHARKNQFTGNDIGVYVEGIPFTAATPRVLDFGTANDPGLNYFICNSSEHAPSGYDVWVNSGSNQVTLPFAGNYWDRMTPSVGSDGAPDRTDVVVTSGGPSVDYSGSTFHNRACPVPHDI